MAEGVNAAVIKALAEANGLSIPEDRLETVLKQYQTYLELLSHLDSFPLAREAEPGGKAELTRAGAPSTSRR